MGFYLTATNLNFVVIVDIDHIITADYSDILLHSDINICIQMYSQHPAIPVLNIFTDKVKFLKPDFR